MTVIALVHSKGGTAKTTTAIHLATTAATLLRLRTAIVDTDPQGSAGKWRARREAAQPLVLQSSPGRLEADLGELRNVDLCMIDTPGHDLAALARAAVVSDLSVIASRPTELDREAAIDVVGALRRFGLPYVILLTQAPHRASAKFHLWVEQYARLGHLADPVLTSLTAFQDSITLGLGVQEYEPNGRAAEEVRAALTWILDRIKGAHQ